MIAECKRRVVALARARPNTAVLDMSLPGPAIDDETRWWDAVHMRPEPMADLSRALGTALAGRPAQGVVPLVMPENTTLSGR